MNSEKDKRLQFSIQAEAVNSSARACSFVTMHNTVQTPVFMPVATVAVLRTQDTGAVEKLGFPVLLANTYHLLLRPGTEVFRRSGGIHKFMNWPRSVLTDSGGYQIFSLSRNVKMTEDGAVFKSYIDGKNFLLSPETSIEIQGCIGSDIMMALDQCVASTSEESVCRQAVDITARWAERSLTARGDSPQALFGIVQGACYPELRRTSASQITSLPFDGFAIGGLAVGETEDERKDHTGMTAQLLPRDHPRYLMGVGTPLDLLEAVHRGVDMFDCILPTALEQGVAFTSHGRLEMRRGVYKFSQKPLDDNCSCPACSRYTRAYLHHLIKSGEYYGANLIGIHNLTFYRNQMDLMRAHIIAGDFVRFYTAQKDALERDDEEHPPVPPKTKKRTAAMNLGAYEVIRQDAGFYSIRHRESGEIMHSVNDPLEESLELYVRQAGLEELLSMPGDDDCVIWDVGLGAGTNAMATLLEYEKIFPGKTPSRGLKIVSFEKDLDSLRLAVRHQSLFPHVRHSAPTAILTNSRWRSTRFPVQWVLFEGDFPERMEHAPLPDCIYYDPFSLHTDGPLWSYDMFRKIFEKCRNRKVSLFTYSASTQVRGALLAAGFYVGRGRGTGPKSETTVAFTSLEGETGDINLLGRDWLEKFGRSSARFSDDCSCEEKNLIEKLVITHPQFYR